MAVLNLIWELRLLWTLIALPVIALLGALLASIAAVTMAWRVCREDADRDRWPHVFVYLERHGLDRTALTFLTGITMVLLGLFFLYILLELHPVPPGLI